MTTYITDPFDSRRTLSRDERERLYPTEAVMTEAMVMALFAEQETAKTFAAMFGLLKESRVA